LSALATGCERWLHSRGRDIACWDPGIIGMLHNARQIPAGHFKCQFVLIIHHLGEHWQRPLLRKPSITTYPLLRQVSHTAPQSRGIQASRFMSSYKSFDRDTSKSDPLGTSQRGSPAVASTCPPAVITMTSAAPRPSSQVPPPNHLCSFPKSMVSRSQHCPSERCHQPGWPRPWPFVTNASIPPAGPVAEATHAPNHPFMDDRDYLRNQTASGAVAHGVSTAGGTGGYSADPDGGQGCCSGLGQAVFGCCGACEDCDCGEDFGECCCTVLTAPFTCLLSCFGCCSED